MFDRLPLFSLALILGLTLSPTLATQGQWEVFGSAPRGGHVMAFDTVRGISVSFERVNRSYPRVEMVRVGPCGPRPGQLHDSLLGDRDRRIAHPDRPLAGRHAGRGARGRAARRWPRTHRSGAGDRAVGGGATLVCGRRVFGAAKGHGGFGAAAGLQRQTLRRRARRSC